MLKALPVSRFALATEYFVAAWQKTGRLALNQSYLGGAILAGE
jgi:hypothetical protein